MPFKLTAPCFFRERGVRPLLLAVRSGLRVVIAVCSLSFGTFGQEPSSNKDFGPVRRTSGGEAGSGANGDCAAPYTRCAQVCERPVAPEEI